MTTNMPAKLPTYSDLSKNEDDLAEAYRHDAMNMLLACPPRKEWVKLHPMIKVKNPQNQMVAEEYIPSWRLRINLRRIFTRYRDEILREGLMLNSAYVVLRLHYWNPASGEWDFVDGVGAVDIQKREGTPELNAITIVSAAVQKALPSAAEYAFKNACKKLGRLFGSELNKNCTYEFVPTFPQKTAEVNEPAAVIVAADTVNNDLDF